MWFDQVTVCSEGYCFAPVGPRLVRKYDSSDSEDEELRIKDEAMKKKKDEKERRKKLAMLFERAKKRMEDDLKESTEREEMMEMQRELSGLRRKPRKTQYYEDEKFTKGSGAVRMKGRDYTDMEYNEF